MVTGVFFVGGNGVLKVGAESISIVVDRFWLVWFIPFVGVVGSSRWGWIRAFAQCNCGGAFTATVAKILQTILQINFNFVKRWDGNIFV